MSSATNDEARVARRRSIEYVPLDQVIPADVNPKGHAGADIDESIERFGVVEVMVRDDRTGKLVAGHGRRESLLRARAEHPEAPPEGVDVDDDGTWLVPLEVGWASVDDDHAEAYLIASNRLVELGGWEPESLPDMLARIRTADPDLLAVTGYSSQSLDDMLAALKPPSLDDLDDKYGEPDPSHLWPVLRFKVAPTDRDRYLKLVDGIKGGDDVLFAHLLDLAERG